MATLNTYKLHMTEQIASMTHFVQQRAPVLQVPVSRNHEYQWQRLHCLGQRTSNHMVWVTNSADWKRPKLPRSNTLKLVCFPTSDASNDTRVFPIAKYSCTFVCKIHSDGAQCLLNIKRDQVFCTKGSETVQANHLTSSVEVRWCLPYSFPMIVIWKEKAIDPKCRSQALSQT